MTCTVLRNFIMQVDIFQLHVCIHYVQQRIPSYLHLFTSNLTDESEPTAAASRYFMELLSHDFKH